VDSTSLFTVALGLQTPWEVRDVGFDPQEGRIDFTVGFTRGTRFTCPHCGAEHQPVHDTQAREWRHLNFFQFQAYIQAKVPRVRCGACGKTTQVEVPWARPGTGFTQLMEALIVALCRAMTVRQVAQLLGVSDMRLWRVLDHYVEQARAQEDFSQVTAVGLDETAAQRGHHYISLFHDLEAPRLLFATEGRKAEVVAQFADDLEAHGGQQGEKQTVGETHRAVRRRPRGPRRLRGEHPRRLHRHVGELPQRGRRTAAVGEHHLR